MEPKIFWVRVARTGVWIRKEEGLLCYERVMSLRKAAG